MATEDLDALEALLAEHPLTVELDRAYIADAWRPYICTSEEQVWITDEEAQVIVAAFNAVPALLARLRAAERDAVLVRTLEALREVDTRDRGVGLRDRERWVITRTNDAIVKLVRAHWDTVQP